MSIFSNVNVWTLSMAKVREAMAQHPELFFLNITRKSGFAAFAPSWGILNAFRSGSMKPSEYYQAYLQEMRASFQADPGIWKRLAAERNIVLVCYCQTGAVCHRYILANILEKMGATFKGELGMEDGENLAPALLWFNQMGTMDGRWLEAQTPAVDAFNPVLPTPLPEPTTKATAGRAKKAKKA